MLTPPSRLEILAMISAQPCAIDAAALFAWLERANRRARAVQVAGAVPAAGMGDHITPIRQFGALAVIPVVGYLEARAGSIWEWFGDSTSYERLADRVRQAVADPNTKQVLLDIDSPGGTCCGLEEICALIRDLREAKPIGAIANPMACSAAYGLGASCATFYATPSAYIGSVGTISYHLDMSKALEAEGIKATVIRSVEGKNDPHPWEPATEAGIAHLQEVVNAYDASYVKAIAKGRGVSVAHVRENFGRGRTVPTGAALEARMIDKITTLDELLAKKSGKQGPTLATDTGEPPADEDLAAACAPLFARIDEATGGKR